MLISRARFMGAGSSHRQVFLPNAQPATAGNKKIKRKGGGKSG